MLEKPRKLIAKALITTALVSAPVQAHDMYGHWTTQEGGSCCHDQDCKPSETREVNGQLQIKDKGVWLEVPKEAIRPFDSPDGQNHACVFNGRVLCFVRGAGI